MVEQSSFFAIQNQNYEMAYLHLNKKLENNMKKIIILNTVILASLALTSCGKNTHPHEGSSANHKGYELNLEKQYLKDLQKLKQKWEQKLKTTYNEYDQDLKQQFLEDLKKLEQKVEQQIHKSTPELKQKWEQLLEDLKKLEQSEGKQLLEDLKKLEQKLKNQIQQ